MENGLSLPLTHLTVITEKALQRVCDMLEMLNGLRWLVRAGALCRVMSSNLPSRAAMYDQT